MPSSSLSTVLRKRNRQWSRASKSSKAILSTSKRDPGSTNTAQEKRNPSRAQRSAFRDELIKLSNAVHLEQLYTLWCPIMGWCEAITLQAAPLFPQIQGQATINTIFGKERPAELFSATNGILISNFIRRYLDAGKIVIVPDVPDRPCRFEFLRWMWGGPAGEFKLRIIDPEWDQLDKAVTVFFDVKWRDLDGRRLVFRSDFRPEVRYLYFHYCCQIMRRACEVKRNGSGGGYEDLKDEVGRPFWEGSGRYLPKNMLLALAEEEGHGHDAKDVLLQGAACGRGRDRELLDACLASIERAGDFEDTGWEESDNEEEEDDDEEEIDEDGSSTADDGESALA
ncbi:uncharacterized protein DSM5745_04398 [Aspergillus mulundensis]|uniref:HNH nuclease domain-containing protein n=1 Tax=Aspergillus mulundensis TaxID=1810919 RepID=A0A3D8SCJ8_9EURO|nr:hypothetical protein DSM5745_04398 [Aspergillus mulundensis]RDW84072.1 hypothetical protein DSM5745_04398 [Aspergillus mulundensis]